MREASANIDGSLSRANSKSEKLEPPNEQPHDVEHKLRSATDAGKSIATLRIQPEVGTL